jgi:integrase
MVRQMVRQAADGSIAKATYVDRLGDRFDELLARLKLKRHGLGFYALRHTHRTWADEVRDQHATHRIMGHAIPGMSGVYVEEISFERLKAVTNHVRAKLFGDTTQPTKSGP